MKKGLVCRSLSLLLSLVLIFGVFVSAGITADAAYGPYSNVLYSITIEDVTRKYTLADDILDMINAARVSYNADAVRLKMDSDLLEEAMVRAAELPIWCIEQSLSDVNYNILGDSSLYTYHEKVLVSTGDIAATISDYLAKDATDTELMFSAAYDPNVSDIGIGIVNVCDNDETFICIRTTSEKTLTNKFQAVPDSIYGSDVFRYQKTSAYGRYLDIEPNHPDDLTIQVGEKFHLCLIAKENTGKDYTTRIAPDIIPGNLAVISYEDGNYALNSYAYIEGVSVDRTYYQLKLFRDSASATSGAYTSDMLYVNVVASQSLSLEASVSPETVHVGEQCTITATASGGTAPYSYAFSVYPDNTIVNSEGNTCIFTPTSEGEYAVQVTVTDAEGNTKSEWTNDFYAKDYLSVTLDADKESANKNEDVQFTVNASGCYEFRNYTVTVNGQAVDAEIENGQFTLSFDTAGSKVVEVTVTACEKCTASASKTISVGSDLSVVLSVDDPKQYYDVGEYIGFTAVASGGTPSYNYIFKYNGQQIGDAPSSDGKISIPFNIVSIVNVTCEVTDQENQTAVSNAVSLTIIKPFEFSLTAENSAIPNNGTARVTAQLEYYSDDAVYEFSVDGTPFDNSGAAVLEYDFGGHAGKHTVSCTVTDRFGRQGTETVEITMADVLTAIFSDPPRSVPVGSTFEIPFAVGGGEQPYRYYIYVNDVELDMVQIDNSRITLGFNETGEYTVKMKVTDSLGSSAECSCDITARSSQHTVSFDTDGGGEIQSQTVEDGASAVRPDDPQKDGYDFMGWFNGTEEYNFSDPVYADVELTAHWAVFIGNCTVTAEGYDLNNISLNYNKQLQTINVTVTYNNTPLIENTDYTITGNTATDSGKYEIVITGIGDYCGVRVIPWKINRFVTLTYSLDGEKFEEPEIINDKTPRILTAATPEDGMKFSHWEDDKGNILSYSEKYGFIVMNDLTIHPVYVSIGVDVSLESVLTINAYKSVSSTGKKSVRFIFSHNVPYECEVIEVGIISVNNKMLGYDSDDTIDLTKASGWGEDQIKNQMFEKTADTDWTFIGKYKKTEGTLNLNWVVDENVDKCLYACGYITYILNEKTLTESTDLVAVRYNDDTISEWS